MNRKTEDKRLQPLTWREVGIVATVCCVLIFVLALVGGTLPESLGLIALVGGTPLIAYLGQRTINDAKTALPLTRGQRLWNAAVFVIFLSVVGLLIWAWRWHPELPIWRWGEPGEKRLLYLVEEPAEPGEATQVSKR
jgi:hypothetical protein